MTNFDLNIEKVLEDWEVAHALREVIANAIDERALTNTGDICIYKNDKNDWCIRDFGRGLRYEHLTQNENQEKLNHPNLVIGKFGVGLKDAFATFDRNDIKVLVKSKYGDITLEKMSKHGFQDVVTLHAIISQPSDLSFVGTEFVFQGVQDSDMQKAKEFFLMFSGEEMLEKTQYGQILKRSPNGARIYVNGVRVADEENFLFSYNITSLTKPMRKALNRERSFVGRTAYKDRVESILLDCQGRETAQLLVSDLKEFESGLSHEELKWINVSVHACKLLNASEKVIFVTSDDLIMAKDMIDSAIRDGYAINLIPENVKEKIEGMRDIGGNPIRDLGEYVMEWNDSFQYEFVDLNRLDRRERLVFDKTNECLRQMRVIPPIVKDILVSETMRIEGYREAVGVWERNEKRIVVKRDQLRNVEDYAGTVLHELAHARSEASDVSREFEGELTKLLGIIVTYMIKGVNL